MKSRQEQAKEAREAAEKARKNGDDKKADVLDILAVNLDPTFVELSDEDIDDLFELD